MKIKNIIFDLGGVILNIDFHNTIEAFAAYGAKNADNLFNDNKQIIDEFGLGKISSSIFRQAIQNYLNIRISDNKFDNAWNAMLINIPKKRIELVKTLRKNYRCFLFSNTNCIHHHHLTLILKRDCGVDSFAPYFEKEYYSYEMGLLKPDIKAYKKIMQDNRLSAEETLFIDDTYENAKNAESLGMQALHLTGNLNLEDLLIYIKKAESALSKLETSS